MLFTLSISTWTDLSIDSSWTLAELCYVHSRNASADLDSVHLAFGHIKLEEDERMVSPTLTQQRRKNWTKKSETFAKEDLQVVEHILHSVSPTTCPISTSLGCHCVDDLRLMQHNSRRTIKFAHETDILDFYLRSFRDHRTHPSEFRWNARSMCQWYTVEVDFALAWATQSTWRSTAQLKFWQDRDSSM